MGLSPPPVKCMATPRHTTEEELFRRDRQSMYRGTHHVSNVCVVKILPLIAGRADSLVLARKGPKNDVLGTARRVLTGPYPPDARDSRP